MMKKIFGMLGAALFSVAGLILAGKSGFGEKWFSKTDKYDEDEFDDAEEMIASEDKDTEEIVLDETEEEES